VGVGDGYYGREKRGGGEEGGRLGDGAAETSRTTRAEICHEIELFFSACADAEIGTRARTLSGVRYPYIYLVQLDYRGTAAGRERLDAEENSCNGGGLRPHSLCRGGGRWYLRRFEGASHGRRVAATKARASFKAFWRLPYEICQLL
jgi:hypothetical protein